MKTLIYIENTNICKIKEEAKKYLLKNISKDYDVTIIDGDNIELKSIIKEYQYIVLLSSSQFIKDNYDLFFYNQNKLFISPTSTVEEVRGKLKNFLFNVTTNNQLLTIPLEEPNSFILYDGNSKDLYVNDLVNKLREAGKSVFNIFTEDASEKNNIINAFKNIIYTISIDFGSNQELFYDKYIEYAELGGNPQKNFLQLIETELPSDISKKLEKVVTSISIIIPKTTAIALRNSYWNVVNKNEFFTNCPAYLSSLPSLFPKGFKCVCKLREFFVNNLIAGSYYNNLFTFSEYLPTNPQINMNFNTNNNFLNKCNYKKVAYFIDTPNVPSTFNQEYNKKYINKDICYLTVDKDNIVQKFKCLYNKGYRLFICNVFSETLQKLININYKDARFISNYSTAKSLRNNKQPFFYSLSNDNNFFSDKLFVFQDFAGKGLTLVVLKDELNNVFIKDIVEYAEENNFNIFIYDNIDDINNLNEDATVLFFFIINSEKINEILTNIKIKKPIIFNNINYLTYGGFYFTESNINKFNELEYSNFISTRINYNSSQVYIDTVLGYYTLPPIIFQQNVEEVYNMDTSILLNYDLDYLYKFGYIIDV